MGLDDEVDEFLRKANVDARAAVALRNEDEATRKAVLERGDMSDCRNPSASLMSRIRVAKENMMASRGRSISPRRRTSSPTPSQAISSMPGIGGPTQLEIDDFLHDNKIDEMASRQLREADPGTQRSVLERGNLTDCRNPSAVLLARIRDAKQNKSQSPSFSQPAAPPPMMYGAYPGYPAAAFPGMPGMPGAMPGYGAAFAAPGGYPGYPPAYGMPPPTGYPPAYGAMGYGAYPGYPPAMPCGSPYGMPPSMPALPPTQGGAPGAAPSPMRYTPY